MSVNTEMRSLSVPVALLCSSKLLMFWGGKSVVYIKRSGFKCL